jgi:tetratricopeptide (TPR) repeat protein
VSLGYNARRLARRGDARAALKLLRKGIRRHPTNAHFRVAAAQLIAADADGAAEGDEANALDRAAAFLDAFVGARDGFDFAGGEETSKERGGEPPRSSSSSSPRDPPAGGGGELSVRSRSVVLAARASLDARRLRRRRARRPGGKNDESGTDDASALRAPPPPATAASTRAFFARACAADPSHAAAFHAWASFERFMGRVHKARRLYRECAKIHPPRAATLQAWGAMEADPANPEGANPEAARRLFREALALDPGHAPTHVAWALMEQRLGMHARASKLFQRGEASTRALKGSARRAQSPRENENGGGGVSLVFFDDRARARSALLAAWAAHEARFNAPRSEKAARRARALFREACDAEPENARAWASWAKAEGEFRFPIADIRFPQTPERDPRDEEASSSGSSEAGSSSGATSSGATSSGATTTALLESSAFGRRLAVLEEGLARCPGNFFLRHARASSLARLGRLEEARDALESLARERPESPLAWHALGWTLRELGAFEDAVDAFVTGARAAGKGGGERGNGASGRGSVGNHSAALNLPCLTAAASTAMHRGDEARARALFMEGSGVASTPAAASSSSSSSSGGASSARDRAAHLRLWATLEKRAGKTSVARALFQRAADADPTDASTWTQWGQFERRASGMDAARATFAAGARRAKPGRGARSRAFLYHAWAAAELSAGEGSRTLARDALERGVAAHPNHAPLWIELGELKLAEGEDAEARVALERGGLDRKAVERRVSEIARLREEGNANFANANFANANANALDDFSILGGGPLDGALPEGAEVGGPPGGAEEVVVRKRRDKASSGSGGVSDEDVSSSASASSSSSYAAAAKEAAVEAAMERERERERAEAALEEGLRSVNSVRSWWEENESIWRF